MKNLGVLSNDLTNYKISDLDDLLNRIGHSLQLDETRRYLAEQRYKTVSSFIEEDSFFRDAIINVYAQGSFRIRTTVKPYRQKEFDLDFVVHLDFLTGKNYAPLKVLDELERCLNETGYYKGKLSRKNRCMRITYENDFHMDITVGCQETYNEEDKIIVPDRKTKTWTPSNPNGYATWFERKAVLTDDKADILLKAYNSRNVFIRLSENLPVGPAYEFKLPLERAVQIIKRYRDVYFYNKPDLATSSVIISTLAADCYQGQLSIFETIDGIITQIERKSRNIFGKSLPFKVLNPANLDENFSEKWFEDSELFPAFIQFISQLRNTWETLKKTPDSFLRDETLMRGFGSERVKRLIADQSTYSAKVKRHNELLPLAQLAGSGSLFTTPKVSITTTPTSISNPYARRHGGENYNYSRDKPFWSLGTCYLQQRWIQESYPGIFKFEVMNGVLICTAKLKPIQSCDEYRVQITYRPGTKPNVRILDQDIKPIKSIHMYSDGSLCLYFPKDFKWKVRTSIAGNTIPWIAEWIICYELWKITGKWEGLEIH